MKKIFTLVWAVCFAIVATAQSVPTRSFVPSTLSSQPVAELRTKGLTGSAEALPAAIQEAKKHAALTPNLFPAKGKVAPQKRAMKATKAPKAVADEAIHSAVFVSQAEYFPEENDWYIICYSRDGRYQFHFDVVTTNLVGEYTEEDLLPDFSYVQDNDEMESAIVTCRLKVSEADERFYVDATLETADGNAYVVTTDYTIPEETGTVTIKSEDLEVDDYYVSFMNCYVLFASSENYSSIQFQIYPEDLSDPYTTYGTEDVVISLVDQEGGRTFILNAEASFELTKIGNTTAWRGSVLAYSGIRYNFELLSTLPEPKETVVVKSDDMIVDNSWAYIFVYQLAANTETRDVRFYIESELGLAGTYSPTAFSLYLAAPGEFLELQEVLDGSITVVRDNNDNVTLTGYALTIDTIRYEFDLSFTFPAQERTVAITFPDAELNVSDGFIQFAGMDLFPEAGLPEAYDQIYCSVAVWADDIVGKYASSDIVEAYTEVGYLNSEDNGVYESLVVRVSNIVVTENAAEETYTLTADVETSAAVRYQVTMTAPTPKYFDFDATEGEVNRAYTLEDDLYYAYNQEENYIVIDLTGVSDDGQPDVVGLVFYVTGQDPDIIVPAGTYTINGSRAVNTVASSIGIVDNTVHYSFYSARDAEGNLVDPIFFLVSGTVVVENINDKLAFTVDAVNSNDLPIHITFNVPETALENTTTESAATKRITRDGQLQILRGEHIYDATGALLQ